MRFIARLFTGSVRRRLFVGFGIFLVMILVFATVAQVALNRVLTESRNIEPISQQINHAQAFALAMNSIETNLQQYVLTGSTAYQNAIRDNLGQMHQALGNIRRTDQTPNNPYTEDLESALAALDRQVQGVFNIDIFAAGAGARNTLLVTIYNRLDITIEAYQALYANLLENLNRASTRQQSIVNDLILQLAGLGIVIAVAALAIAYIISRSLARPISRTAAAADQLAAGKLDTRVEVGDRHDEIGRLARAFNAMADQLRGLIGSLEERVRARTRDLFLTLEVGQISTRLYQREDFLPRVVEFIHESFGLYYAQVYLIDDARRYAVLRAGTTEVGQRLLAAGHRLPLDQTSLVARAVQTQTPVLVDDTTTSEIHKPNPLLPDTRSEVAIPLIVGDEILGVLDLQSRQPGTFNTENLPVFEAMASQLAAALRNVQSFAETRAAIERADLINRRLTEQRWGDFLGKLSRNASVGYAYDLQAVQPLTEPIGETAAAESPFKIARPVSLRGQQIGAIVVADEADRHWSNEELNLIEDVAERVALAVEQYRAADETARLAAEMQTVAEVSTEIGGTLDVNVLLTSVANLTRDRFDLYHAHLYLLDDAGKNLVLAAGAGEIGQLMVQNRHQIPITVERSLVARAARSGEIVVENDVRHAVDFLPNPMLPQTRSEMAVPMLIGDRVIGVLDVQGREVNRFTDRDQQILSTLAAQVAIAVQNARLFDETARLAAEMQTVAEVSTEIGGTLDVNVLLTSVANLTRDRFDLYHAHLYLLDDAGKNLVLAAGAGEIGQLMVQNRHQIPITVERSLVARAARSGEIVVENDVRHAVDFLPNPMLPQTRSEMAVPMLIGDRVIGVLDVQGREVNRFTDRDQQILSTLAAQVAIAVQNARLFTESQQRLAVIENAPFMVLLTTFDGRTIYSNRAAIKILDVETIDDVLSMALTDVVPPEELERLNNEIIPVAIERGVWQGEGSLLRHDGTVIPTDMTLITIYDRSGQPEMLASITADISARKLAERERFEREALLNLIINTSPDWIFTKDTHYRYLLVNKSFAQFYGGLAPEEMIGKDDYELGTPVEFIEGDPEKGIVGFRADDRRVIEGGESIQNPRDVVQHNDGTIHIYDTTKLPLRDETGRVIGVLGVSRDMTEQYQAAEARERLLRQTEEQARRLALLNEMAAALSTAQTTDELFRIATTHASTIFDAQLAGLALVTPERDTYELYNMEGESSGMRLPLAGSWVNEILDRQQVMILDDLSRRQDVGSQWLASQGLRSSLGAPLYAGDQILGTLTVSKADVAGFDETDASLMQQIASLVASRLQNQTLLAQTQARVRDLQTLNRVADRIRTINDPTAMLDAIARVVAQSFGADSVVVSRFYHQLHGWRGMVGAGDGMTTEIARSLIEPANAYPHGLEAVQRQDVVVIEDTATYPEFPDEVFTLTNVKSVLVMPVVYEQDYTGVLFLNYTARYRRFSPDEITLARGLCDQIAVGFNQHLVEQQIHRRAAEMQTVAEVGTEAASALDMDQLLKNVVNLAKERFGLYHAHIYLLDQDGDYMVLAAGAGEVGDKMVAAGHRIPVSREASLVAQAARERRPVIVNNVTLSPEFLPNPMLPQTRSEMAVPMIVGDQVVGVLDLQSDRLDHFDDQAVQVQSTLASQVAVAVQNARLYAEQVQVADTLREVDRLKTEFLASMSHELRTPLNSIIGYAEVLLDGIDGELNEDMQEDIGAIHGSGKHLLSLINDVLDLAKIEAGQMDLVREGFDIKPVIEDMVNSNRVLVKDKPVRLLVDIPDNLPFVRGDQLRVRQVINNLLSNAVKFTEEGDIVITAEVYQREPSMVMVSIADSGIGMTPDQVRVIFDRFRQVDQSHTRRAGGTGLGLAITKELVEMHGGMIWVESVYGTGSTFHFTLPIAEDMPLSREEESSTTA